MHVQVESPYGPKQNEANVKTSRKGRVPSFSADKLSYRLVRARACMHAPPSPPFSPLFHLLRGPLAARAPLVLKLPKTFPSHGIHLQMPTAELGKILAEDGAGHAPGSRTRMRKRDRLKRAWRRFRDFGGRE